MKCCDFVADMLIFAYDSVTSCCVTPASKETPPKLLRQMGELSRLRSPEAILDMIVATRTHWYMTDHVARNAGCASCVFLKDFDDQQLMDRRFKFKRLNANHVENCNLICTYCYQADPAYNRRKPKQLYRLPPLIRAMLQRELLDPTGDVMFGGGEPTLGEDFEELVTMFDQIGLAQNVNTNAVRFSSALERAMRNNSERTLVTVSIDAGTRDTYARVKGADVFDQVLRHVSRYAETGGRIRVKYIILPDNCREIEQLIDRLSGLKLVEFSLDFDCGILGHPAYADDLWDLAERAADRARAAGFRTGWNGYSRPMMTDAQIARAERLNRAGDTDVFAASAAEIAAVAPRADADTAMLRA